MKISCGATRLDAPRAPSYAYKNMQTFDDGESHSGFHTPLALHKHFRLPSEVHSVSRFSLQSHRLQLSWEKEAKLTYPSSTVSFIIHICIWNVNMNFAQNYSCKIALILCYTDDFFARKPFFYCFFCCFSAAPTSPRNSGCALFGRLLNSG